MTAVPAVEPVEIGKSCSTSVPLPVMLTLMAFGIETDCVPRRVSWLATLFAEKFGGKGTGLAVVLVRAL